MVRLQWRRGAWLLGQNQVPGEVQVSVVRPLDQILLLCSGGYHQYLSVQYISLRLINRRWAIHTLLSYWRHPKILGIE